MADQNLTKKYLALYAAVAVLLVAYAFVLYRQDIEDSITYRRNPEYATSAEFDAKLPKVFPRTLIHGRNPQMLESGTTDISDGFIEYVKFTTPTGIEELRSSYLGYLLKTDAKVEYNIGEDYEFKIRATRADVISIEVEAEIVEAGTSLVIVRFIRPHDSP